MDIRRKLQDLLDKSGLTEEEIQIYLSILKGPKDTIFQISKKAKIPKDRAYLICESLEEKNLISIEKEGKFKKITANPLNNFVSNLHSQGRKLHRTADTLKEISPFLHLMGMANDECMFKTFSEEEAGEAFIDLSLLKWEYVLAYGAFDNVLPAIKAECDQKFVENRLRRGKKAYPVIVNPGEYSWDRVIKNDKKEMRDTKVIYDKNYPNYFVTLAPDVNTVGFWLRDEEDKVRGAIVENALITKLHENIYRHFEGMAKPHSVLKNEENSGL